MARSNAATVAPPAKRRKPHARTGSVPDLAQTYRRPARRSSGPAKGRTTAQKRPVAAAEARPASVAAPRVKPRSAPRAKTTPPAKTTTAPLVRRVIQGRTGALLDGLLRGRACVGIVFVLLVGVVFSNVSLLQMNKGIAATNAQATAVEQENAKLRRQIAPLASSERIQAAAVKHGYSLPAAGDVAYIRGTTAANAKKAAGRIVAPGMGEGTASRPAAQVQQEQQAAMQAQNPTAPVTTAPSPEPAPASAQATPATPASCQPSTTAGCQPPAANPTAPSTGTAP